VHDQRQTGGWDQFHDPNGMKAEFGHHNIRPFVTADPDRNL
jgi:hypothetical protein